MRYLCKRGGVSGIKHGGGAGAITKKPPLNPFSPVDSGPFRMMADNEEHAYYDKQKLSDHEKDAFALYTNPVTEPGSLYNFSQNMNYAVLNGLKLTSKQKDAFDAITGSMHNLGFNAELTRYDHYEMISSLMNQAGISGSASQMTPTKLKKLIGKQYKDDRILSTSANNFKNSSNPYTFTTRLFKFTYQAKAGTQAVMPGYIKTPGFKKGSTWGDTFGEILLSPKNSYKIKDIRYSGAKARLKGTFALTKKQIEVIVEVE